MTPEHECRASLGAGVRSPRRTIAVGAACLQTGPVQEIVTPGWVFVSIGVEGDPVVLDGLNVWDRPWTAVGRPPITVAHPTYPQQRHRMDVYELRTASTAIRFAAGEFSNGVWGIFVPGSGSGAVT